MKNLILILILCTPALAFSQTWKTGSGGNSARNGMTSERGPASEMILWEGGSPAVIAQQAVIDGHVLAMSRIRDIADVLDGTDIVAQHVLTGSYRWTTTLPVEFPDSDWRNRVSAIGNGHVYATRSGNTNMSYLYALDTMDGSIVWRSEDLIDESSTESVGFAMNGDLIVGNNRSVLRIDFSDGTTVWEVDRRTPTSNGQEVAIHEGYGYIWEPSPRGPLISRIDLNAGIKEASSVALSPGLAQQLTPWVGPDGTIYAPRTMNNPITDSLFALEWHADSFRTKWTAPIGYVPFSTSAVAPDGSIYTYSRDGEVMRLDKDNGDITHRSIPLLPGRSSSPRMCIDAAQRIYVTNGEFDEGGFYVFDRELNLLWSTPIFRVNIGGPAMGPNGTLVVCGVGTDVRAYKGIPTSVDDVEEISIEILPNPVSDQLLAQWEASSVSRIHIVSGSGATVYAKKVLAGERNMILRTSNWSPGTYHLIVISGNMQQTIPFAIQR